MKNINTRYAIYSVVSFAFIKSLIDITCRVRNEISERSSLPGGQLVNEQRVLLINSPCGTSLRMDLIAAGWLEIYCTAEFNYSIILSRWAVAISKIHIQRDQNRRFDHSEYFVASREFNMRFYLSRIENSLRISSRSKNISMRLLCHLKKF